MYSVTCVEDLQDLNPYVIVGAGGGGEKFSNLEGIETVGFLDDNPQKQGKPFCGLEVASNLDELFERTKFGAFIESVYFCAIIPIIEKWEC